MFTKYHFDMLNTIHTAWELGFETTDILEILPPAMYPTKMTDKHTNPIACSRRVYKIIKHEVKL
jgi:hypothetical protein